MAHDRVERPTKAGLEKRILRGAMVLLIVLTAALLVKSSFGQTAAAPDEPEKVRLVGAYQIDGGPWRELTPEAPFDASSYHTITVRGNFSRDIPEGQELLIYIRNLFIALKVNGREIYACSGQGGSSPIWKTPGVLWGSVRSMGIAPSDEVELTMTNAYVGTAPSFHELLDNLQIGKRAQLYEQMLENRGGVLLGLFAIMLLGLAAILLAVLTWLYHWPNITRLVALSFFSIIAARWILREANLLYMPLLTPDPILCAVLDILIVYLLPVSLVLLNGTYESKRFPYILRLISITTLAVVCGMFLLQLAGALQLYEAQPFIIIYEECVFTALNVMTLYEAVRDRNRSAAWMFLTLLPAYTGALLENLNYSLSFMPRGSAAYLCCVLTLLLQLWSAVLVIRAHGRALSRARQLEAELTESRTAIMLSQIQPHFLYNALSSIGKLCYDDPKEAYQAILMFSKYLRGNLDSLSQKELVPFEQELEHVRLYLALEQLRFEERLRVVYDIRCDQFKVPVLTVQPIVENAVRYGVTKRPEGGTVTIRTQETADSWRITVADDGVGFDPQAALPDGRSHTGIQNVRARLEAMCGGRLELQSVPGQGTTAAIVIPKREKGAQQRPPAFKVLRVSPKGAKIGWK